MSLQSHFYKLLMQTGCIPVGSRVLVAVSGGADSVALLLLLYSVSDSMDLHLEVAHLDHSLRETSCVDGQFVELLCSNLDLPLTIERIDVAEIARQRNGNLEEVARNVRREFLVNTAAKRNCDLIALGQQLDDQAETFMMRLLRGSGTAGLCSMRLQDSGIVRPLLPFSRDEIVDYLREEGQTWREDESNSDLGFTRNRIRHQLMPLLKSFNPNIASQLSVLIEQLQQDETFWATMVEDELGRCGEWRDECFVLSRRSVNELAPALAARVVRAAIEKVRGDLRSVSSTHVNDILGLFIAESPQGELDLPGVWVARRYDDVMFCKRKPESLGQGVEVLIDGPGTYRLPGGETLHVSIEEGSLGEAADKAEFSATDLSFPLLLRSCRPGDRLQPSGMQGTKKLQDLFVDLKMTKEERQRTLLLLKDQDVVWVVGVRRSALFPVADNAPVLRFVLDPSG